MNKIKLQPSQVIVISFFFAIVLGAALLSLPISTATGCRVSLIDSFFVATSAVCVTGLVPYDIGAYFSQFGKLVILCLMQAGGLGIMTFSAMFAILLGKKFSMSENITIRSALSYAQIEDLRRLILYIILFTFAVEAAGALLLYTRWLYLFDWGVITTLKRAAFHSVSAFCNAGFSLFPHSIKLFSGDIFTMSVFSFLIITGGLGFVVFTDIPKLKFWRKDRKLIFSRISLQTKIVVLVSLFLIIAGTLAVYCFENGYALRGMTLDKKLISCIFTSVTARTAGFNVLGTDSLRPVTLFTIIMLMFIGASPGSTGGGIKTVNFGIILASFYSMFRNRDRITIFKKTIPKETYRRVFVTFFLSIGVVLLSTFLLSATERVPSHSSHYFLSMLFESTSAFGTVGLSMGITPELTFLGKIVIIFTMLIGRVGPLTLALAIAMKNEKIDYRYPEERLIIG
ncbi:MAG: potassium transporter TrkG [Candidatus Omnitrophica bacterium]|jgi:trk system potassium uptake protein TrkH|nr:potassium transporter TrkG [Candidatus Omnitrophota bacterium]